MHMLRDRNLLQGVTQGEVIQVFERKAAEENVMDVAWGLLGCVGNGDTEFWVPGDQRAVNGTRLSCGPDVGREVLGGLGWGLRWGSQDAGWGASWWGRVVGNRRGQGGVHGVLSVWRTWGEGVGKWIRKIPC